MWFLVRIGRLAVNPLGIFWRRETVSKSGKVRWEMNYCVFTGKPEHTKQLERMRRA